MDRLNFVSWLHNEEVVIKQNEVVRQLFVLAGELEHSVNFVPLGSTLLNHSDTHIWDNVLRASSEYPDALVWHILTDGAERVTKLLIMYTVLNKINDI